MNSAKDIVKAVETYIELPDSTYAIMIDGDWGCGKTYLWKHTIRPMVGKEEALYVSLFGLKSIEDIDNEIFNTMSLVGESAGGLFKDIFNKVSFDVSGVKLNGVGFLVQYGMQKWKEIRIKKGKKLFVCFDDLERWVGDVSVCLAYINKLVEHDGTKCLILGNVTKIGEQNKKIFNFTKDKTIGFKYMLTHDPSDVFEIAFGIAFIPDPSARELLVNIYKNNMPRMHACLLESRCSNIRTVSVAISYLGRIAENNYDKMRISESAFVDYFIALLSTVILVDMYRTSDEDRMLMIDPESRDALIVLEIMGLYNPGSMSKDKLSEADKIAEGLVEKSFYGIGAVKRVGICSIVRNGFYKDEDFEDEFSEWRQTQDHEIYLDTFKVWYMDDESACTFFRNTYKSVFEEKSITNPHTLLLLAGRMTYDVKRGVLEHDFETLKNQYRELFKELYNNGKMDHIDSVEDSWVADRYQYCHDLYEDVKKLNKEYNESNEEFKLSEFWLKLKREPDLMENLLPNYRTLEIFEQYNDVVDIVQSLDALNNSQLFELTRWMGSRLQEEPKATVSGPRIIAVSEAITFKYGATYGVRAGHFKQIARILKNRNTDYDPESSK